MRNRKVWSLFTAALVGTVSVGLFAAPAQADDAPADPTSQVEVVEVLEPQPDVVDDTVVPEPETPEAPVEEDVVIPDATSDDTDTPITIDPVPVIDTPITIDPVPVIDTPITTDPVPVIETPITRDPVPVIEDTPPDDPTESAPEKVSPPPSTKTKVEEPKTEVETPDTEVLAEGATTSITNAYVGLTPGSTPDLCVVFDYAPIAPAVTAGYLLQTPALGTFDATSLAAGGHVVVQQAYEDGIGAGIQVSFLAETSIPMEYAPAFTLTANRVVDDCNDLVTPPETITATPPIQDGNTVTIPSIDGVEYFNVDTDEALTGTVNVPEGGIDIGARPTGENPVTGGPWSFEYIVLLPPPTPTPFPTPTPVTPPMPTVPDDGSDIDPPVSEVHDVATPDDDELAATGASPVVALWLVALAVLIGSALVIVSRRRKPDVAEVTVN